MSKCRITISDVGIWIYDWNEAHPDIPMTYTASLNYVAIGHRGEHGGIDVICSGSTAREAWEKFRAWKSGFAFGKEYRHDNMGND